MKIRRGFVTNSSSSSFILAYKSEQDMEDTIRRADIPDKYKDLLIRNIKDSETVSRAKLKKFLMDWYRIRFQDEKYFRTRDFKSSYAPLTKEEEAEIAERSKSCLDKIPDGSVIYVVEQGDSTPEGGELEFNILPELSVEYFSNH